MRSHFCGVSCWGLSCLKSLSLVFDSVRLRSVVVVELANFLLKTSLIVVLEVVTVDFNVFFFACCSECGHGGSASRVDVEQNEYIEH